LKVQQLLTGPEAYVRIYWFLQAHERGKREGITAEKEYAIQFSEKDNSIKEVFL
jgi:hypothetical protein